MKRKRGTKRTCPSCGTRFYDLGRESIACPKCHAAYSPEDFLKNRRARPVPARKRAPAPAVAKIPPEAQATELKADLEMGDVELRKEDEAVEPTVEPTVKPTKDKDKGKVAAGELIEDAAELGEDEDDMAEVMDSVEEKGDR